MSDHEADIETVKRFIDDFQFNLPAMEDWNTEEDHRAYNALAALDRLTTALREADRTIVNLQAELETWDARLTQANGTIAGLKAEWDRLREALNGTTRALEKIAERPAGDDAEAIGISEYAEAMLKRYVPSEGPPAYQETER